MSYSWSVWFQPRKGKEKEWEQGLGIPTLFQKEDAAGQSLVTH